MIWIGIAVGCVLFSLIASVRHAVYTAEDMERERRLSFSE